MKAAILYGREDVRVERLGAKPLGPGEVRVSIGAALTCGTDVKVFKRGYHARMIVPPAAFGHEMAGVIAEVGPEVGGWQVGERVFVANSAPCGDCFFCRNQQENLCDDLVFLNGAYAESIVVPRRIVERNMVRLKAGTGFADAALAEPLACVTQGVRDCRLRDGQRVLVIGSGPIGLMFVALARYFGCTVTVAGRGERRLAVAKRLGAARVIDVSGAGMGRAARGESAGGVAEAVSAEGGEGFDVVIEAVGQVATWEAAIRLARKGGTVNLFGGCPAGSAVELETDLIHYSSLTLVGSFHHTPGGIRQALGFIEKGLVRAADFVDGECSLEELPGVLKRMAEGNGKMKTLVRV